MDSEYMQGMLGVHTLYPFSNAEEIRVCALFGSKFKHFWITLRAVIFADRNFRGTNVRGWQVKKV